MERIAWMICHVYISWSAVILTLASSAAICLFLALYLKKEGRGLGAALYVPMAVALSLVLSRLAHWYFRQDSYGSAEEAMVLLSFGGFALMGVFAGCILAATAIRLIRLTDNLPELLDCLSIAGSAGISLGRLASFFNSSDRGMAVTHPYGLPWTDIVINPVSGTVEYRVATFLLQSMAAGAIFCILLVWYLSGRSRENWKSGDITLAFLLCYGASQVVLDSTRYDSLYLRSNGFVSAVQVLSAGMMAFAVILLAVRLVRAGGWKKWHPVLWLLQGACFAAAGYMEYHVQRYEKEALFAYSVMAGSLICLVSLTLLTRSLAAGEARKHAAWLRQIGQLGKEGT